MASRCRGPLVQVEVDVTDLKLAQQADQVWQGSTQPTDRPRGHQIKLTASDASQQSVQTRPLLPSHLVQSDHYSVRMVRMVKLESQRGNQPVVRPGQGAACPP